MDTGWYRAGRYVAMALLLLSSAAGARPLSEIKASGELRICIAGSSAAFYQSNAESFARYLEVAPKVTHLDNWDQQFHNDQGVMIKEARYESNRLASGSCDLFPNDLHMLDWRLSKMRLVPYYNTRKMVVAHRELRSSLKQASDLAGRTAAVQKGTAYESWLRQQNENSFKSAPVSIELHSTSESISRVASRKVDFSIIGAEAAFKWVRGDMENLDLLFPVDEAIEVGWGISPSAGDLAKRLEAYFADSLRVGSDIDRAWQRQYGISLMEYQLFDASFATQTRDLKALLRWLAPLGTGLLGIVLAMLFWTRRLNREIAEHKKTEAALINSQDIVSRESKRRLAITQISFQLQQANSLEELGRVLLSGVAREIPLGQALFCLWHEEQQQLLPLAHYAGAGPTAKESLELIPTTSSLIQRCLDTHEIIQIDQPDAASFRIRSGLGNCHPASIVIYPLIHAGSVRAVLELATLDAFGEEQGMLLSNLEQFVLMAIETTRHKENTLSEITSAVS